MANETFRFTPVITPTGTQRVPFSFMGSHNEEVKIEEIRDKPSVRQTSRNFSSNTVSLNTTTIKREYNNDTDLELQNNPLFCFTPIDSDASNWMQRTPSIEQTINIQQPQAIQHRQQVTTDMSTTVKTIKQRDSSDCGVNVFEEKICKYCREPDWSTNLIRPCSCRGNQQHAHQQCVQNDIETNYMDCNKRRFTKRLQCESCKFQYIIKTYKEYSISKSLRDPLKFNKLFWLLSSSIILFQIILATIILVSINGEEMRERIDLLILTIIGCLVCLSLVLILTFNIFELIVIFEWQIMDRMHATITDEGLRMNQDELNLMLEMARQKVDSQFSKVHPYQQIQQTGTIQSPVHQTIQI